MRAFVTGGTGFIGSQVVRALTGRGHEVTVLNRSPEKEGLVRELGGVPVEGELERPERYRDVAADHDALVHAAFDDSAPVEVDRLAIDTLLEAARSGNAASFLYTSGCWVLGDTNGEADEAAPTDRPARVVRWRPAHEDDVLAAGSDGLSTAVVRPGMVYGGHSALTGELFRSAVEEGAAAFVGDGRNHWSMVYRGDLARLYVLILEERATGVFHGVDGLPVRVVDIARAASEAAGAGGAVRSVPVEEAREKLGPVADALTRDQRLVAPRSRELGWMAEHPSFPETAELAFREWREATG